MGSLPGQCRRGDALMGTGVLNGALRGGVNSPGVAVLYGNAVFDRVLDCDSFECLSSPYLRWRCHK